MTKTLTGLNALAYTGVNAPTPANSVAIPRAPTVQDYASFNIGDQWINTVTNDVWILVDKGARIATWLRFIGTPGFFIGLQPDVGGLVAPVLGVINIHNVDTNIITSNAGAGVLDLDFAPSIIVQNNITIVAGDFFLPATSGDASEGVIYIDNFPFISNYLGSNTFVGKNTGIFAPNTGVANNGFGQAVLASLTSGGSNNAYGLTAGFAITSGNSNSLFGSGSAADLTTGSSNSALGFGTFQLVGSPGLGLLTGSLNVAIGANSGNAYRGAESNNILISNVGVAAQNAAIRIGTIGTQTTCAIAGIYGANPTLGDSHPIVIDSVGRMGTNPAGDVNFINNIRLPATNGTSTQGVIYIDNFPFISNYLGSNTFVGKNTGMFAPNTGVGNNGFGNAVLASLTSGGSNNAFGLTSGFAITSGNSNSLFGSGSGAELTSGSNNSAFGYGTLALIGSPGLGLLTGTNNIAIGYNSGNAWRGAESNNIVIGTTGTVLDSASIQIGTDGLHTTCFIQGIDNSVVPGSAVFVNTDGQLGLTASSERYKENIEDLADVSNNVLNLRPVMFNYKSDESKSLQFGLIAEEVEDILPNLVIYDKEDLPMSVKYHELPVLLLNEIQKLNERVFELERILANK